MHWFCNTKFPQMNRYDDWFISGDQMNLQFSNWKSSWRSISECIWFWSILKVHELKACKINNWIHFSQKFDIKITWVFWLFQLLIFSFIFVGYWTRIVEIISKKWFYYRNRKQERTTLINRFISRRLKWFAISSE